MSDKGRYGCGCHGARHAGDDTDQGRRTLRLKSLSPAQPPHRPTFSRTQKRKRFSAASGTSAALRSGRAADQMRQDAILVQGR